MFKELINVANTLDKKGFLKLADRLDKVITKLAEEELFEASGAKLHFPIDRHEWQETKHKLRDYEIGPELEQRDLTAMQEALDGHSGPEGSSDYLVIDPFNTEDFRKYVQRGEDGPDGKEIIIPLNTFALAGTRLNYFKTANSNKYGFVAEHEGLDHHFFMSQDATRYKVPEKVLSAYQDLADAMRKEEEAKAAERGEKWVRDGGWDLGNFLQPLRRFKAYNKRRGGVYWDADMGLSVMVLKRLFGEKGKSYESGWPLVQLLNSPRVDRLWKVAQREVMAFVKATQATRVALQHAAKAR